MKQAENRFSNVDRSGWEVKQMGEESEKRLFSDSQTEEEKTLLWIGEEDKDEEKREKEKNTILVPIMMKSNVSWSSDQHTR